MASMEVYDNFALSEICVEIVSSGNRYEIFAKINAGPISYLFEIMYRLLNLFNHVNVGFSIFDICQNIF